MKMRRHTFSLEDEGKLRSPRCPFGYLKSNLHSESEKKQQRKIRIIYKLKEKPNHRVAGRDSLGCS